jgi:hypothetical protein
MKAHYFLRVENFILISQCQKEYGAKSLNPLNNYQLRPNKILSIRQIFEASTFHFKL